MKTLCLTCGEGPSGSRRLTRLVAALLSCGITSLSMEALALAPGSMPTAVLPSGHRVDDAAATIVSNGGAMVVTQHGPAATIHWDRFDIGAGNTVQFKQPDAMAIALNLVAGRSPSTIAGTLVANGRVFLVNPNGVTFTSTASVDVGGLVASTLALDAKDVPLEEFRFKGAHDGTIINHGTLAAASEGVIALIGGRIENRGHIAAPKGDAILSSGTALTLSLRGPATVVAAEDSVPANVINWQQGLVTAGRIQMTADSDVETEARVANKGELAAISTADERGSLITISASGGEANVSGTMDATGELTGGEVLVRGRKVRIEGDVHAVRTTGGGGDIKVIGESQVTLPESGTLIAEGGVEEGRIDVHSNGTAAMNGGVRSGSFKLHASDIRISRDASDAGDEGASIISPDFIGGVSAPKTIMLSAKDSLSVDDIIAAPIDTVERLILEAGRSVRIDRHIVTYGDVTVRAGKPMHGGAAETTGRIAMEDGSSLQARSAAFEVGAAPGEQGTIRLATVKADDLIIDLNAADAPRLTPQSKVYDGLSIGGETTLSFAGGLTFAEGSNLQAMPSRLYFEDSQVGNGMRVSAYPSVIGHHGLAKARVRFAGAPFVWEGVGDITARPLTVTLRAESRVYNGDHIAQARLTDDRVPGDRLEVAFDEPAVFADKNVGTAKRVTATVAVSGADSGNYRWEPSQRVAFADITPRPLHWRVTAEEKAYDGTRFANVVTAHKGMKGDVLAVRIDEALFEDKNAGPDKVVALTGVKLEGEDSGNYALQPLEVQPKASISPRPLKVSATIRDKDYDSTRYAEIQTLTVNKVEGDDLNVLLPVAFEDKNAGRNKAVIPGIVRTSGDDAPNYWLFSHERAEVSPATIHPRLMTVSATAAPKTYDGTTTAEVTALSGDVLPDDKVIVTAAAAAFDDRHAGIGKPVTVGALKLEGVDQGNYRLAAPFVTTTADITPRPLPVVATVENKVYDGSVAAKVDTLHTGALDNDDVAVVPSTASFEDARVGLDRLVTLGPLSLTGASASDYVLPEQPLTAIADILPKPLRPAITAENKVYDGGTSADVTARVDPETPAVPGDQVDLAFANASFSDRSAAQAKPVVVSGLHLTGRDAANYELKTTVATTRADIEPRPLTVALRPEWHVYDGTTLAQVAADGDPLPGDRVAVLHRQARFDTPWPGLNKAITVTGLSLDGPDAPNYALRSKTLTVRGGMLLPQLVLEAPWWISACDDRSNLCGMAGGAVRPGIEGAIRLPPDARRP